MVEFRGMLFNRHKTLTQSVVIATGSLLLCAVILPSYFHLVIVLWTFLCGLLICHLTVSPYSLAPNLLLTHVRRKQSSEQNDELTLMKKICPVCGKEQCSRHRPELNIVALQPWCNIKLPNGVDAALQEFLNLVVKEFIYTWYRDLSQDEAFVDELRSNLRFTASVLLRRLQKVNIPSIVIQKILPAAMRHLHFYLEVKRKADPDTDIQQALLDFYGKDLHCAMRSRRAELDYIKGLVTSIFPYLLPLQSLQCKSLCVLLREILSGVILLPLMDVLADPDIVNNLLLIFLDKSPPPIGPDSPPPAVPFLSSFSQPLCRNSSCLRLELDDLLEKPEALFPFMQFLKKEASVNVLQFYLSAEEFNNKILTPELSQMELDGLHQQLKDLYRMYCDPAALDRIHFEEDDVQQLQQICDGPTDSVIKLQITTPLFRAHDHAYDLLRSTFLPLFHQSDDYYQLLCGERHPSRLQRSLSKSARRPGDAMTLSKIGSKIKGVFKTNAVEGKVPDDIEFCSEDVDEPLENRANSYEDMVPFRLLDDGPLRDLSPWRVMVTDVVTRPEPENSKKTYHAYGVEVRRVDVMEESLWRRKSMSSHFKRHRDDFEACSWRVERRYAEFYVLEQKLAEFHGDFDDVQLPAKKAFGTKSKEFVESKLPVFEHYLQKLLTKPTLRGSELLYTFLTSEYEFASSFLEINLGKMVKSGAMKLVKERGQHLDPFLQSFLVSTESAKVRPSRFSDHDSDTVSISSEKMANSIFDNNANVDNSVLSVTPKHSKVIEAEVPIDGVYDTLMYLAERVFGATEQVLQVMLSTRIVLRRTLDTFLDWYMGHKLNKVAQEHRLVHLIHLLRDVLFFDNDPPRTDEEKLERKERALSELKEFIPKVFVYAVGKDKHQQGTELIFEILQQPKLNKQLSYMLLDILFEDVFPELASTKHSDSECYYNYFNKTANNTS